jgi:hypothetical protein
MTPTDPTSATPDLRPSAAVYCRVSTRAQADEGSSLDSQEAACRSHVAALGLRPVSAIRIEWLSRRLCDRCPAPISSNGCCDFGPVLRSEHTLAE